MARFWAGFCIAVVFHLLLFAAPIHHTPLEPSFFPTATVITVRFNPLTPSPPPDGVESTFPPEPASIPKAKIEPPPPKPAPVLPQPKPRHVNTNRKPAVNPPKPQPEPKAALEKPATAPKPAPDTDVASSQQPRKIQAFATAKTTTMRGTTANQTAPAIRTAYPKNEGNPPPEYPTLARRRGWEGTVQLFVRVLENGQVGDIMVIKSSGHSLLDKTALETVKQYRFVAGEKGDQKIAMWVEVPVHFRLQNAD